MKTLLTIGSSTMLLPQNTDPAAILKLLIGARMVRSESHYGPDGREYSPGQYFHAEVIQEHADRITVACVSDEDVCTLEEWNNRVAAARAKAAEQTQANLSAAA